MHSLFQITVLIKQSITHNSSYSLLLFVFLTMGLSVTGHAQEEQATLDLSSIELSKSSFKLDTTWEFYWLKLLEPSDINHHQPDSLINFTSEWSSITKKSSFGYATYHLSIILPNSMDDLALNIPIFYSSYKLFVNDFEISKNGKVGTSNNEYEPYWLPQTVPLPKFDSDTLNILIQVANYDHSKGGAFLPLTIGSSSLLFKNRYIQYGYSFFLTGILIMGGLLFLGLYFFGWREKSILYFALFCLVYCYRVIGFGSYSFHILYPDLPWIISLKLEYISLFLSGLLFGLYTLHLYPKETYKPLIYVLSAVSIIFSLQSIFLSPFIFTQLVIPYIIFLIFYFLLAFWIYIKAVINKKSGAVYSLLSTAAIFMIFGYKIVAYFGNFKSSIFLLLIGYIFFFFFQSLVHLYRYSFKMKTALLEAEQSSKAKSQFLSTMSHEIRTPLNAVIGLSGLLSESSLTPKQQEFSKTIKKSGENLLRIINNILDFSKIESGKLELEENEINLRESIEHVLELVGGINTNPNLEVLYDIDDNVPPYVAGDAVRLQQILTNLISNSLKFTTDGEILIHLTLKHEFSGSITLQYEISDTGIGIPKDKLNRLFQRFSQVDGSSTRKFGGTGLGLVISKRLVEAMGGKITVSSIENIGSTFTFTILFKKIIKEVEIETRSILKNKKVFLLADNSRILNILQKRLASANLHVTSFNSSTNLISHINDLGSYDFGLMDMQMSEINGIEVAERIRELYSKENLPLVLMSSKQHTEHSHINTIFNLVLPKPIIQTSLSKNLEQIFNSNIQIKEPLNKSIIPARLFKSNFHVLIVEDNLVNQLVAHRILERFGIKVDIKENGKQAVEAELNNNYDLIFMDMEMPIMDGLEATRIIKANSIDRGEKPFIVAMTAYAMPEDRERCFEAGMDDFLAKPITLEAIKEMLLKWLGDN